MTKVTENKHKIPSWPKERNLSQYSSYTAVDFSKDLSQGKIWIDVGCRTGTALSQTKEFYAAKLVGINAHKIKTRKGIQSILANIPEDRIVYKKYRKKAHLITDLHGAISFAENPIEALIYESCLLKPNAKAVMVTLAERLGPTTIWNRIRDFFAKTMKQTITFKRFTTYSDTKKTPISALRITIQGHCQSSLKLDNLFIEARNKIGHAQKTKIIAEPEDKSFQIWQVRYKVSPDNKFNGVRLD